MNIDRNALLNAAKRVVVKIGSNVLTRDNGLNLDAIRSISAQVCRLMESGRSVILVSSGAMAAGLRKLHLRERPEYTPARQAVSAVGQAGLIREYEKAFAGYGRQVAQLLLTAEDMNSRKRYLNARNALNTLLSWGVVPIINENDTVMVEEIQFGDNDNLSAVIALLMDADALINLTDIDGLYTKDPRRFPDAQLIGIVDTIGKNIERLASDIPGALGTGGMLSKIRAARKVTEAGLPMIIAKGLQEEILDQLFAGSPRGTYFVPKSRRLSSRKCWIGFTTKPKGTLRIDDGAARAIQQNGKSLLPSGITAVEGDFRIGDPVQFQNSRQDIIGNGLVNYSAADIRHIMGKKSSQIAGCLGRKPYDEVVHRDNLVITL
ncbi:MAG: glutamate 5-kinase [Desulfobacterales bacterium]|jgi:glutamate 5-kinase